MMRALGMWGLTEEGRFIRREGIAAVLLQTLYPDAQTQVTRDLRACAETVRKYADEFQSRHYSEPEIRRELLSIFRQDLLKGLSGPVLEAAEQRDREGRPQPVPWLLQVFVALFIVLLCAAMLLYIYLFAMGESASSQSAWFQSFVIWIVLDAGVVATTTVFLNNVLLPRVTANSVRRSHARAVEDIRQSLSSSSSAPGDDVVDHDAVSDNFNAAHFFFVSVGLAKRYPRLVESKMILRYHTVFPREPYSYVQQKEEDDYRASFIVALMSSFTSVAIFVLLRFLQLPHAAQDAVLGMASAAGFGYAILKLIGIYTERPQYVIGGVILVGLIVLLCTIWDSRRSALSTAPSVTTGKTSRWAQRRHGSAVAPSPVADMDLIEEQQPLQAAPVVRGEGALAPHDVTAVQSANGVSLML